MRKGARARWSWPVIVSLVGWTVMLLGGITSGAFWVAGTAARVSSVEQRLDRAEANERGFEQLVVAYLAGQK